MSGGGIEDSFFWCNSWIICYLKAKMFVWEIMQHLVARHLADRQIKIPKSHVFSGWGISPGLFEELDHCLTSIEWAMHWSRNDTNFTTANTEDVTCKDSRRSRLSLVTILFLIGSIHLTPVSESHHYQCTWHTPTQGREPLLMSCTTLDCPFHTIESWISPQKWVIKFVHVTNLKT